MLIGSGGTHLDLLGGIHDGASQKTFYIPMRINKPVVERCISLIDCMNGLPDIRPDAEA